MPAPSTVMERVVAGMLLIVGYADCSPFARCSVRSIPRPQSPSAAPSRRASAPPSRRPSRRATMWVPEFIVDGTMRWPKALSVSAGQTAAPVELDLEAVALAAEVRQVGGRLRVHAPVDQRDQRLHHVEDDAAAARRAEHGHRRRPSSSNTMVGAMELRGRLPGPTRVGDGLPVGVDRHEGEVGQLVVEQEPRRPVVRAERRPRWSSSWRPRCRRRR